MNNRFSNWKRLEHININYFQHFHGTQPGKVHISSDAKALLPPDRYRVESRGLVWVKVRIAKSLI